MPEIVGAKDWRIRRERYCLKPGENGSFPPRPVPLNSGSQKLHDAIVLNGERMQTELNAATQKMLKAQQEQGVFAISKSQPTGIIIYNSRDLVENNTYLILSTESSEFSR